MSENSVNSARTALKKAGVMPSAGIGTRIVAASS